MNALSKLALLGWTPAVLVMFALLPLRVAILAACIGGWLLLPQTAIQLAGLPDLDKSVVINAAMLVACMVHASSTLLSVRPNWVDLPIVGWVAAAFLSAIANETGIYDASSAMLYRFLEWGIPYWIGRAFFTAAPHLRLLLWGLFLGGLAYVLPALWEIRMSPQLHRQVYGAAQHSFGQTMRGGGFRPQVFMPHGLALSLWMAVATVAGTWLWRRQPRSVLGVPHVVLVAVLGATMILCKSFGATILLVLGLVMVLLPFGRMLHVAVLVVVPLYLFMRVTHSGGIDEALDAWMRTLPVDRAGSMQFRLDNEALLIDRGWQKPLFGWTPWAFLLPVEDEHGNLRSLISDSMWIIHFACYGLVGFVSNVALLWLAGAKSVAARAVAHAAEVVPLGMIVTLFQIDSLVNAFPTPPYILIAGAVLGADLHRRASAPSRRPEPGIVTGARLRPRAARRAHVLRPRTTGS